MESEADICQQIVGEQLSGVTFVMDYIQLQFNPPPILNVYTPVTVLFEGKHCMSGEDQFKNRLCEQITKIVKSVSIEKGESFSIAFEDSSIISISLKPSDYVGPEALQFIGQNNLWVVI